LDLIDLAEVSQQYQRFESLFEVALRSSGAISDSLKEDLHCVILPYTLIQQVMMISSSQTSTRETSFQIPDAGYPLSGFIFDYQKRIASLTSFIHIGMDGFCLNYIVKWPLSLVISQNAIGLSSSWSQLNIFIKIYTCKKRDIR